MKMALMNVTIGEKCGANAGIVSFVADMVKPFTTTTAVCIAEVKMIAARKTISPELFCFTLRKRIAKRGESIGT